MEEQALNIVQWNCRSIKNNPTRREELKKLAQLKQPHIICISETWLTTDIETPRIKGYTKTFRRDRPNRDGGGLLILVREDIKADNIQINSRPNSIIEAQGIEITLTQEKIKLLHIYNPEDSIVIDHLNHLVDQLGRKYIIVGDLNGHHTMWDPNVIRNNTCGADLADYLLRKPDVALATTPGLHTHTNNNGGKTTLDLTLCSPNLLHIIETFSHADFGSDHLPVHTKLNTAPYKIRRSKRPQWKLKEDRWDRWREGIPITEEYHDNVEEGNKAFTSSIKKPAEKVFGKTSPETNIKYCKPWWTPECSKEIARRRRARKTMERRPTIANIIDYKRCVARAKRCLKTAKKNTWRKFCNNLTPETPTKEIWNMIRKMNGKNIPRNISLKENNMLITEEEEQARIFADRIQEVGNNASYTPINEEQKNQIEVAKTKNLNSNYNSRFTMEELKECLRTLPSEKVTGDDDIHNKFLKNLPEHKITELLRLINKSYRLGEVPKDWKKSLVIHIPKAGKDLSEPSSYRPISLLSCVSKVIEKLVNTRLSWHLETKNKLSHTQCGFRKRRSTEDILTRLEHQVRSCLVNRKVTISIFFDLQQAFDTVSHEHLLFKLASAGIEGNMLLWIQEFLTERTYSVLIGNHKSEERPLKIGLPQGSNLSPTLFNLMIADIPHPEQTLVLEYADDLSITVTANTLEEAIVQIRGAITTIEEWTTSWLLTLNPEKTKAMCFTKKRIPNNLPDLTVLGETIEWVKSFKYLGLIFDAPTLTWRKHVEDTCRQGHQRINIMKSLAGTTWGADREMLLTIYKVFIRSKLTYGSTAIASAAQTTIDNLNKIQSAALRVALGARRSTPIVALQVEANIPPLATYIEEINCKYFLKARAQGESHPLFQDMMQDRTIANRHWTAGHFKKPLVLRSRDTVRQWNIPEDLQTEDRRTPTRPPWQKKELKILPDLKEPITKSAPKEMIRTVAQITIEERYKNHLQIFTDGSKIRNSTSAAMWIPEMNYQEGWKLEDGDTITIMSAELLAINKAMQWTALNGEFIEKKEVAILTDSRSSLEALQSFKTSKYAAQEEQAYRVAEILKENGIDLTLQWVPSHVGLQHNEKVDAAADTAHALPTITHCPLSIEETKNLVRKAAATTWQTLYDSQKDNLHDAHFSTIKPKTEHWPWANHKCRPIETAITRLRLGHVELNEFLHRTHQRDSPTCTDCDTPETVEHYLLHCRRFTGSRQKLITALNKIGIIIINIVNLLGGGEFSDHQQSRITEALGIYLRESGRLHGLNHA